jgi:RNA polymerase sigma factor (TIGR02999 family)
MSGITRILSAIEHGDPHAAELLLPVVYEGLRKLAAAKLGQESPGQSLDATALVHEAYLRMIGDQRFEHRGHFFAAAAQAMRRILIDNARRKKSLKRGGAGERIPLNDVAAPDGDECLLALDDALTRLGMEDPLASRIVELHHFGGLTHEQVAETLATTVSQAPPK